ncbi:MAG: class I lanthipeptide [Deltaproteobacteria bacterium]|nr:class I lanthipeptide [Deltaproteobacteria bacterium]
MKKLIPAKKLQLNTKTVQSLSNTQMANAAGGKPNTGGITDVLPHCGSYNC